MSICVEKILNGNNVRQAILESTGCPGWKVTNISWNVSSYDVVANIKAAVDGSGTMSKKDAADGLGITVRELEDLLKNNAIYDFVENKIRKNPKFAVEYFELPNEVEIPAGEVEDMADVKDWITSQYGWGVKRCKAVAK